MKKFFSVFMVFCLLTCTVITLFTSCDELEEGSPQGSLENCVSNTSVITDGSTTAGSTAATTTEAVATTTAVTKQTVTMANGTQVTPITVPYKLEWTVTEDDILSESFIEINNFEGVGLMRMAVIYNETYGESVYIDMLSEDYSEVLDYSHIRGASMVFFNEQSCRFLVVNYYYYKINESDTTYMGEIFIGEMFPWAWKMSGDLLPKPCIQESLIFGGARFNANDHTYEEVRSKFETNYGQYVYKLVVDNYTQDAYTSSTGKKLDKNWNCADYFNKNYAKQVGDGMDIKLLKRLPGNRIPFNEPMI